MDNKITDLNGQTWISGCYSYVNGAYSSSTSRICLEDYVQATPNAKYTIAISDSKYRVLVREMNGKTMLSSHDFLNGAIFTSNKEVTHFAISVYCPSNGKLTFDDYCIMITNGFTATCTTEESQENKEPTIDETPIVEDTPITSEAVRVYELIKTAVLTPILTPITVNADITLFYEQWNKFVNDFDFEFRCTGSAYAFPVTSNNKITTITMKNSDADFQNRLARTKAVVEKFRQKQLE